MTIFILRTIYLVMGAVGGVVLFRWFMRSRNPGFLLLMVGLALWPLISWLFGWAVRTQADRALEGGMTLFPFSLVSSGKATLGEVAVTVGLIPEIVQFGLIFAGLLLILRSKLPDERAG